MIKIALDAGHGYNTAGKRTPNGVREWSMNNKVTNYIEQSLESYEDVKVYRLDDTTGKTDVPLATRVSKANNLDVDVLVSIHHNALNNIWKSGSLGVEVYYHSYGTTADKKLANLVAPKLADYTGLKNRGVKHNRFHILTCNATAILCEGGFMDYKGDYEVINSTSGQKAYAKAVVESLVQMYDLKEKAKPQPQPQPTELYRVRKSWKEADTQKGAYGDLDNAIAECKKHKGYKVYDSKGTVVYPKATTSKSFLVEIIADTLNVREEANFDSKVVTTVKKGQVYTIVEEKNGLGKLKSGKGYISLNSKYVKRK